MYKSKLIKCVWVALLVITFGYSQSKKRAKKEVFTVNKDVTLEINTSHADVEFDTWNKNKVEVEAIIEVEDATVTDEEIENYLKKWNFKAIGNSEKVTVTSKSAYSLFKETAQYSLGDPIIIEEQLPLIIEMPEIAAVPELPITVLEAIDSVKFDYEAFQKNGEAYMKEWQEKWKNSFDEEKFKEGMERWKKEFHKQQQKLIELKGKIREKKGDVSELKKKANQYEKQLDKIDELAELAKEAKKYKVKELLKQKEAILELIEEGQDENLFNLNGKTILNLNGTNDNVFFLSNGNKRFKVKKTIKIKMPKKAKLKLNVRHGEVTIASVSENMDAKLSHAALYANVINGANTTIESSYAPIHVTKWNSGSLKVNFIENVDLQLVNNINLMANSSKISVGTLGESGIISGTIGKLLIHNINDNFKTLDVILENTDARIQLPSSDFKLYYIGSNSRISYPESVVGTENKTQFNTIVRGYQNRSNTNREININAKYSKVVLNKKS